MDPDDFIQSFLTHDYDAVKRREYYLKTRHLKGRKPGFGSASASLSKTKSKTPKKKKTPAQRRKEVTANLEALKTRLEALRSILKDLVAQAKKRGGGKIEEKKDTKKEREPSKLSAKQKADAKKRSKAYYDKHKGSPEEQVKQVKDQIKTIQDKIAALRAQLDDKPKKHAGLKSEFSSTSSR